MQDDEDEAVDDEEDGEVQDLVSSEDEDEYDDIESFV